MILVRLAGWAGWATAWCVDFPLMVAVALYRGFTGADQPPPGNRAADDRAVRRANG